MSTEEKVSQGRIEVTSGAIASIVNHAVRQCYGVVGMANRNLADGIARLLSKESRQGIEVRVLNKEITVDVYVVIEYGMRISAVANSIKHTVSFHVEQALGIPVKLVNVYVQGLRFSEHD
jgi:uncharacterized alkaline shock family protein YloU